MSKSRGGGWLPRLQSLSWVTFMQLGTQQSCDMWQASCFVCSFPLAPPSHISFACRHHLYHVVEPDLFTMVPFHQESVNPSFFPFSLPSSFPRSLPSLNNSGAKSPAWVSLVHHFLCRRLAQPLSLPHLGTLGQSVCILQPPCLPLRREGVREVM